MGDFETDSDYAGFGVQLRGQAFVMKKVEALVQEQLANVEPGFIFFDEMCGACEPAGAAVHPVRARWSITCLADEQTVQDLVDELLYI